MPTVSTSTPTPPPSPASSSRWVRLATLSLPYLTATVLTNRWIPHQPTPTQAAFLSLPSREAMFGGAAGGGKSDALLMAALQYVDMPDYSALLLRRSYSDLALPEGIMSRAHEWL